MSSVGFLILLSVLKDFWILLITLVSQLHISEHWATCVSAFSSCLLSFLIEPLFWILHAVICSSPSCYILPFWCLVLFIRQIIVPQKFLFIIGIQHCMCIKGLDIYSNFVICVFVLLRNSKQFAYVLWACGTTAISSLDGTLSLGLPHVSVGVLSLS